MPKKKEVREQQEKAWNKKEGRPGGASKQAGRPTREGAVKLQEGTKKRPAKEIVEQLDERGSNKHTVGAAKKTAKS